MTFKALNSSRPLTDKIPCLKNNGIVAVGRYYTRNKKNRKLLKPDEANELSRGGIHIWAIYQDRQNQLTDFSRAKGLAAGAEASEYAQKAIKQPPGSAIYFSVDFDPPKSQYESSVKPFFEGVDRIARSGRQYVSCGRLCFGVGLPSAPRRKSGYVYVADNVQGVPRHAGVHKVKPVEFVAGARGGGFLRFVERGPGYHQPRQTGFRRLCAYRCSSGTSTRRCVRIDQSEPITDYRSGRNDSWRQPVYRDAR